MNKILLLAMMTMMMASCNSETPDVPGNNDENIENPVPGTKNPTLSDLVSIHKELADVCKNKPANSKEDLDDLLKDYNYVRTSYMNNKYTIHLADSTVSVLDLNSYKTKTGSVVEGSRAVLGSRTSEETDSVLSNSKVLLWESAPFGQTVNNEVGILIENYVGKENVTRMSGNNCTWQSLMELSEYAMVIINGLGVDGRWIVTGQEFVEKVDYSSLKDCLGVYSAIVDGKVKHYYMVNNLFITRCISPLVKKGVVLNASASGTEYKQLADAFAAVGYPFYVGFNNMVDEEWAARQMGVFVKNMMVERFSAGDAFKYVEEESNEFMLDEYTKVKVAIECAGEKSLYCPYTAATDRMAVNNILEHYNCAENLTYEYLLQNNLIVLDYEGRINMLDLGECGLEGEICKEFSWLDKLYLLNLDGNSLSGEIPSFMGDFANMTSLMLNDNKLTGNIPASFQNYYEKNAFVNLTGNQMNGQIPFGKYVDAKSYFTFDCKYDYLPDGTTITNDYGLWYADEPF